MICLFFFRQYSEVIFFVRMWVEISLQSLAHSSQSSSSSWGCELKYCSFAHLHSCSCHPLREDVSWNASDDNGNLTFSGHPLREDVSWNNNTLLIAMQRPGHPLREDVSWNVPALNVIVGFVVILFVRMWVEIPLRQPNQLLQSRHPLREDVSWNDAENAKGGESISHPLREDVSWNINRWGGERMYDSHPLREDVSWNLEEYGVNHRCSNMVLLVGRWIEISLIVFLSFARRSHYYTSFNLNIKLNYRNLRGNFYMCS